MAIERMYLHPEALYPGVRKVVNDVGERSGQHYRLDDIEVGATVDDIVVRIEFDGVWHERKMRKSEWDWVSFKQMIADMIPTHRFADEIVVSYDN